MFDTVLFDFDGTLTPSLELWVMAFQYALSEHKLELSEEDIIKRCFYRAYDEVAAELDIVQPPDSAPHFGRLVEQGLAQAFENVQLFPQVLEVLQSCRQRGLSVGLVTSSSRPQINLALGRLSLADYFDTVVSGSDITNFKPHPEPVELALRHLNRRPDRALMVGDSTADMLAGRAAGTRTALFLPPSHSRFYDFDKLRATRPDFIFTNHTELLTYLS